MLHGCCNKQVDKGSMEEWKPERTNITEQGNRKSNEKGRSIVSFDEGSVIIGEESYTEWKEAWKKLKKILTDGQKINKQLSLVEKELQNETLVQ